MSRFIPINSILTILFTLTLSTTATAQELTADEARLVELVNAARAEQGLVPLAADQELSSVARNHSLDMAQNRFFSHNSPTTGSMADRLNAAHVPYRRAGENIAFDADVDAAHRAFMASEQHRQNVLNPDFTRLGVGVIRVGERVLVTQAFMHPRGEDTENETQAPAAPTAEDGEAPGASGSINTPQTNVPQSPAPQRTLQRIIPSPFELLNRLTGTPSTQQPQSAPRAQTAPSTPQPAQPQPTPEPQAQQAPPPPGLYIVREDGTFQRVELDSETLMRVLTSAR